jgi:uncharacterized protein
MKSPARLALIIMAKAPEPGLAKTRLIPALGINGAARLAKQLLDHTLQTASQTTLFDHRELCVTPSLRHPAFSQAESVFNLTDQSDGDLGARMQRAFDRVLSHARAAIMIGTDAPALTPDLLDQAAQDLEQHDAVFIPALDGGYTLIGLRQVMPELFTGVPWSTAEVMPTTRARLAARGASWHEYPHMADIDEPRDLIHVPAGWST